MIILFPGSSWSKDNTEHDNEHEHTDFSKHVNPDNRILKSNVWVLNKVKYPLNESFLQFNLQLHHSSNELGTTFKN